MKTNAIFDLAKGSVEKEPLKKDRLVSTQTCPWRRRTLTGEVDDDKAWAAGGIEGHAGLFGDALSIHTLFCEILTAVCHGSPHVLDPDILAAFVRKDRGRDYMAGFVTPGPIKKLKFLDPCSMMWFPWPLGKLLCCQIFSLVIVIYFC